jgi:cardiolipin synthase (CMP-forming)
VTVASQISVARLCLVPIFVVFACRYGATVRAGMPDEILRGWALGIFIAAAVSDGIDGWVARRFDQRSEFGAFIDPIADKALLLSGVITLSLVPWGGQGWSLPLWFAAIVILRDCIILGGIRILYFRQREVRIAPHWSGKICTVTQMIALGWVMLKIVPFSPIYPCVIATFFTVLSSIYYIQQGRKILKGQTI